MKKPDRETQRFRIRLNSGESVVLSYSSPGKKSLSGETSSASVIIANLPRDFLDAGDWWHAPDMAAALAYNVADSLGGGTVEDLRDPALIDHARKACEIPEDAVA